MSTTRGFRVRSLGIVAALLGGAAIAACGSTGHPSRSGATAHSESSSALRFSQCMRANGAPNFPDPGPHGYQFRSVDLQVPATQSAVNACHTYLPRSGTAPLTPVSERRQELELAQCMRAHGVQNFPDPNAAGDIQFPIDSPIPRSPAFQRAQSGPCKKYAS